MAQPTHRDLKKFCDNDGWDPKRRTDHWRYIKRLPDGRALRTKVSFGSGEVGDPGLFAAILREQLQVSSEEFWRAAPPLLSAATVLHLRKLGVSLEQVRKLRSQAEAAELLERRRGRRER